MFTGYIKEWNEDKPGWVAFICTLLSVITRAGFNMAFGYVIIELKKEFNSPMAELNFLGSGPISLAFLMSFIPRNCINYFGKNGYRYCYMCGTFLMTFSYFVSSFVNNIYLLYFTYMFISGVGLSFSYMATSLILTHLFPRGHKRHVFANSCVQMGFAISCLLYNPFVQYLVIFTSWRNTLRIVAAIVAFVGIICNFAFNIKEKKADDYTSMDDQPETTKTADTIGCASFLKLETILWCFAMFMNPSGNIMIFLVFPHYFEVKGLISAQSSILMLVLGLIQSFIFVIAGLFGDLFVGRLLHIGVLSCFLLAVDSFSWSYLDFNFGLILIFCSIYGIMISLTFVYIYPCSAEATDLSLDVSVTCTIIFRGIGLIVGPAVIGFVYDYRSLYSDVFKFLGSSFVISSATFLVIILVKYVKKKKKVNEIK